MTALRRFRGLPILVAFAGAVLAVVLVLSRVSIRTDMTDFLPSGHTPEARVMLEQLRFGAGTSMIMLGIEGAPPATLARISRSMTTALDRSPLFLFVNNGDASLFGGSTERLLFRYRYLLSPAVTPQAFSVPALHADMVRLLRGLESSAAPLVSQFGLADPSGAFLALLKQWIGASQVRSVDGVWFAPHRDRALIILRTNAQGMDLENQQRAQMAIRTAFADNDPGSARLVAAGPAVFARQAADLMRADVTMLSLASTVLLSALLFWRFRSIWVLLLVAVPVLLGIAAAALAVQILFGFVHGVAIGFGVTMLGVSLDYPVLLVGHRKLAEPAAATLQRISEAFRLAVCSASLGLTGMLFAGIPGLAQLGCFSLVGLLVAAGVTRWILPHLIVAADLAPVSAGDPARFLRVEHLRVWRGWAAALGLAAIAGLALAGGPRWQTDLAALSPVPPDAMKLDASLRRELGAPDTVLMGLVQGQSVEDVLQREEKLLPTIDALTRRGVLVSAELAASYLPSAATQLARRAILPDPETLTARVAQARAGLPFRPDAFVPFIDAVTASRALPPLLPADIHASLFRARLDPLLFSRAGVYYGLIAPTALHDPAAFAAALHQNGVPFVDVTQEMNRIVADYTGTAWRWFAIGGAAAMVVIAAGLRSLRRVLAVAAAIVTALLVTVAILTAIGTRLSLIQVVSLQLVAGVGLDYALFFARRQLDQEERARTLRTLVTCNAMTMLSFGVLTLCRMPLLRQIGITVAIGAVLALVFAFLFAGVMPRDSTEEYG
ncbi:MAG TPA: MMPL family transporter [Acetobacteraceae bacterium]|nr:MMPL family transporter [Acetobacteraceae bacterium]